MMAGIELPDLGSIHSLYFYLFIYLIYELGNPYLAVVALGTVLTLF